MVRFFFLLGFNNLTSWVRASSMSSIASNQSSILQGHLLIYDKIRFYLVHSKKWLSCFLSTMCKLSTFVVDPVGRMKRTRNMSFIFYQQITTSWDSYWAIAGFKGLLMVFHQQLSKSCWHEAKWWEQAHLKVAINFNGTCSLKTRSWKWDSIRSWHMTLTRSGTFLLWKFCKPASFSEIASGEISPGAFELLFYDKFSSFLHVFRE